MPNNWTANTFLCGFINGFLDFVKSLFDLFAFVFQFVKGATDFALNESYYLNLVVEYIENGIDALSKFDVLDFFKKTVTLPIEFLLDFNRFLLNLKLPSVNLSKIAYFSGYVLLGIVQIVLEIIFTGGSVSIERLFAKSSQIINGFIKKAGSFADNVFSALDKLISLIKKGADHFAAFIRQVLDDFFEWLKSLFKSGKADEVFEGDFLENWDDLPIRRKGYLGAETLRRREIKFWMDEVIKISKGKSKLIVLPKGHKKLQGNIAGFNPFDGNIYVQRGLTEYEIFHEFKHLEEYLKLGQNKYLKGMKRISGNLEQDLIRTFKREKYVFDEIIKNKNRFNHAQLEDAQKYINRVIKKCVNAGININKI